MGPREFAQRTDQKQSLTWKRNTGCFIDKATEDCDDAEVGAGGAKPGAGDGLRDYSRNPGGRADGASQQSGGSRRGGRREREGLKMLPTF